jgi:hypothetical protein
MRCPYALAWLLAAALAVGCGRDQDPPAPAAGASADVAPRAFEMRGTPGPWWRAGATQVDFDGDSRACLRASREARQSAPADEKAAAAYAAFLECMAEREWRRGTRPPQVTAPVR